MHIKTQEGMVVLHHWADQRTLANPHNDRWWWTPGISELMKWLLQISSEKL